MNKRVVITGIGIVNPSGNSIASFWQNVLAGKNSIRQIHEFANNELPTQVAGKLENFDPRNVIPRRFQVKIDTFTKYAWVAASQAIKDANLNLDEEQRNRVGVWLGNNAGGWDICERGLYEFYRDGPQFVNPWQATAWFLSSPQGYVTIANKLCGNSKSFVCDRASSASALYFAMRNIQQGENEIILAGGTEAPVTPFAMNCYIDIGEMAITQNQTDCYKPFSEESKGLLVGEGAAILVLEEYEHAIKRQANIYGELIAASSYTDADAKSSHYFAKAMEYTLEKAKLYPSAINVVYAEGAGVNILDQIEAEAISKAFKSKTRSLTVTCPKSGFGHLYGASSATDLICGLLGARYNKVVPTPNVVNAAPYVNFNLATTAITKSINYFMVNSRAREGANYSLIVSTTPS